MISIIDYVALDVETLRINSKYYLEKNFTKLMYVNTTMLLCLIINQVDSCHSYIYDC